MVTMVKMARKMDNKFDIFIAFHLCADENRLDIGSNIISVLLMRIMAIQMVNL